MVTRTIEIEDNLDEIIKSVQDDIRTLAEKYIKENNEKPDLSDLDYSGDVHDIIDDAVPVHTSEIEDLWYREIDDLWYLYGDQFEDAFNFAGIGDKNDDDWPHGWKAAAIYCYIEQEISDWFVDNIDAIFEDNKHDEEEN